MFVSVCPPFSTFDHIDVDFGNDDFEAKLFDFSQRKIEIFVWYAVEFVVALKSNRMNWCIVGFEEFDQLKKFFAFAGKLASIVVVNQSRRRIGSVSIFERFQNEL